MLLPRRYGWMTSTRTVRIPLPATSRRMTATVRPSFAVFVASVLGLCKERGEAPDGRGARGPARAAGARGRGRRPAPADLAPRPVRARAGATGRRGARVGCDALRLDPDRD